MNTHRKKTAKAHNKAYYHALRDIVLLDLVPLLINQGWQKSPFRTGYFGGGPLGFCWEMYKFDAGEVQSLVIYLSRHWSGYDRHPELQIEYRIAHLPKDTPRIWETCDISPMYQHADHLRIERRFRPLGLNFNKRYGFTGSRWPWLCKRRQERCLTRLRSAFSDTHVFRASWVQTKQTPVWQV